VHRMTVVLAVLAGVLALLVPAALADQTYDDPAADSGAAPDITSVAVTNDNAERVTFRIRFAQPGQLTTDTVVWLLIDLDRNSNTGGEDGGEERMIAYDAESDSYYYASWNGTALVRDTPANFQMLVQDAEIEISIPRPNLGTTQAFDFWLYADKYVGDEVTAEDSAPDGTAVWTYTFETKAVQLRAQQPQGTPRFPVAGKRFVVSTFVFRETDGSRVTSGTVQCTARIAGKPLAAKPSFAVGQPSCAMTVPKTARGKILTGTIAVATKGGQVARPFRFKVL
jgi:hypothetical protein